MSGVPGPIARLAVLAALAALACAPSADALTVVGRDGATAQPYQRWVDRARVPTVPGTLLVSPAAEVCAPDVPGCYPNGVRREVGVSEDLTRVEFLHELGHDYDLQVEREGMRGAFMWLIGVAPWYTGNWHPTDGTDASPNEQFADAYAACALGLRASPWDEYHPTRAAHRRVCELIRRSGGWYMTPVRVG